MCLTILGLAWLRPRSGSKRGRLGVESRSSLSREQRTCLPLPLRHCLGGDAMRCDATRCDAANAQYQAASCLDAKRCDASFVASAFSCSGTSFGLGVFERHWPKTRRHPRGGDSDDAASMRLAAASIAWAYTYTVQHNYTVTNYMLRVGTMLLIKGTS